jgi:hypothetical protein
MAMNRLATCIDAERVNSRFADIDADAGDGSGNVLRHVTSLQAVVAGPDYAT